MISLTETLIGGGVTLVVTYLGWRLTRTKRSLQYALTESDLFPTDKGHGKYYAIKLLNDGNKEIKNITADIMISDAKINNVTQHIFINDLQKTENRIKFNVNLLNQKEELSFVITTDNATAAS